MRLLNRWPVLTAAGLLVAPPLWAQGITVDLTALYTELQQATPDPDATTMVWWMPDEFWTADPSISEADAQDILRTLGPYTVIAATDGTLGPFGGVRPVPEAELRASVRLVDVGGNEYRPLPEEDLDPDVRNFAAMMQPMFANMLGPMGENFQFFFFPAESPDGARLAEATEEGQLVIVVGEREFRWRLPLGSLLPVKICPVDGERLSGAWKYCPWHGVELQLGPPDATGPIDSAATEPIQSIVLDEIEDLDGAGVPEWARYVGDRGVMRYALTACLGTLATIPVERRQFFATVSDLEAAGFGLTNQFDCQR